MIRFYGFNLVQITSSTLKKAAIRLFTIFSVFLAFSACTTLNPITYDSALIYKQAALTENQVKIWAHMDMVTDSISGMSLSKAHNFLVKKKGDKIIVGVIDSGVDIGHHDLQSAVWDNIDELPNNGRDDDNNGYIDDTQGWNFLGTPEENMLYAPYALARLVSRYEENPSASPYNYEQLLSEYEERSLKVGERYAEFSSRDISTAPENFKKYFKRQEAQVMYKYNLEFDPREMYNLDNPDDWSDRDYGNPNVIGFKDKEFHGTHVAGILAGIANNEEIMVIRAIPDGDEYDKDVALAIRYAVDNGAKVVNMSFGKAYSEHPDWVQDAIKYAAENDVLLVHAAGNDAKNIDVVKNYPSDNLNGEEIADNMITVGAITRYFNSALVSEFSNYGKENVDLFAPGSQIWSTVPNNGYANNQGTSMAAPMVAGVATLVRSYYPTLTAPEVKWILMESGLEVPFEVTVPGTNEVKPFAELCKSGRILNAYNALLMADKMAKKKKRA